MGIDQWPSTNAESPEAFRVPDSEMPAVEEEKRPDKLFRAITVNPEQLTVEMLRRRLVPGTVSKDDPKKVLDGNELGVYMSTNPRMVEYAYARGGMGASSVETPKFVGDRGVQHDVPLPSCGVVYEISTKGLAIRKPEITPVLEEVYNNGFQGDEWIADSVNAEHYAVKKLLLSRWANDAETFSVTVTDPSDEGLQAAVDAIKEEFAKRRASAEEFRTFVESLSEKDRMNEFRVQRGWETRQADNEGKRVLENRGKE